MEQLNGSLKTRIDLSEKNPLNENETNLTKDINNTIKPEKQVNPDDVHMRIMYLASDSINAYGGRFPEEELRKLTSLIPGAPVMAGHRRDRLPLARSFKSDMHSDENGRRWVRAYFYWMREARGAGTLKLNIDSGVYRDCSLCFSYTYPECSICGEDMRRCPHIPLQTYPGPDGDETTAFYYYRGVSKVLEISLVFRGANPGTKITGLTDRPGSLNGHTIIRARSRHGMFDITIQCDKASLVDKHRSHRCLGLNRGDNSALPDCYGYLSIGDGLPQTLFIEENYARGFYRFSKIKIGGKHRLYISREDNNGNK
ncbi:MAG: hypothetical protein GF307_11720 [candidate division Zixibacteria bacterium]|nr:hypothetical protein [candidate division Zixibacteria bacterium]